MGLHMGVFWLLLLGICVAAALAVIRGRNRGNDSRGNSALRILEERYARGEISKQEFEERRRELQS